MSKKPGSFYRENNDKYPQFKKKIILLLSWVKEKATRGLTTTQMLDYLTKMEASCPAGSRSQSRFDAFPASGPFVPISDPG